jgi:hypothetical protein
MNKKIQVFTEAGPVVLHVVIDIPVPEPAAYNWLIGAAIHALAESKVG